MSKVKTKDTHWPPMGVRDLSTKKEVKNAGALTVTLRELINARPRG